MRGENVCCCKDCQRQSIIIHLILHASLRQPCLRLIDKVFSSLSPVSFFPEFGRCCIFFWYFLRFDACYVFPHLESAGQCMFLWNGPPTPPQHLLFAVGKMLGLGRGRWVVLQKHTLIRIIYMIFFAIHYRCQLTLFSRFHSLLISRSFCLRRVFTLSSCWLRALFVICCFTWVA